MNDVPLWQSILGFSGVAVWGILCGLPALVLYSLAARSSGSATVWIALLAVLLVWFPLVTAVCIWAMATLFGIDLMKAS